MACVTCGKADAPSQCAQCRTAVYCNVDCQRHGWVNTHERACVHFQTFAGRRENALLSNDPRERAGFDAFVRAYERLGYTRPSRRPYKSAGLICDAILQFARDYLGLEDEEVDALDTAEWHASVEEDVRNDNGQWSDLDQLWRNLPDSVAAVFITNGRDTMARDKEKRRDLAPTSKTNIDRSRLSLLPGDLQLMLFHDLPAVSVLHLIDDPQDHVFVSESVQQLALKALVQRDIIDIMKHHSDGTLALMPLVQSGLNAFAETGTRVAYDMLCSQIAKVMATYNIIDPDNTDNASVLFPNTRGARFFLLKGRHFELRFSQHVVTGHARPRWKCKSRADENVQKIIRNALGVAISKFSSAAHQGKALDDLLAVVIQKFDIGVKWVFDANPHMLWHKYHWKGYEDPTLGILTYQAIPEVLVVGPETGYHLVAFRYNTVASATRYRGRTVATMLERSRFYTW